MKNQHKKYSRPKRPFDKTRIMEEGQIKNEFGLKNKKEIWMAEAKIKVIRGKAKKLISSPKEERELLFNKLRNIGLEVNSIGDVLALDKKDYLRRRLQTIVLNKKLVNTAKEARQAIVHKKVLVNGQIVNSPSFIVTLENEKNITLKPKKEKKIKPQEVETSIEEKSEDAE